MTFRVKVYFVVIAVLICLAILMGVQVYSIIRAVCYKQSKIKLALRSLSLAMMLYIIFFIYMVAIHHIGYFADMPLFGRFAATFPTIEIMDGKMGLNTFFIFYPLVMIGILFLSFIK